MKNIFILLFSICIHQSIIANVNYKLGYVILNNGDTLNGFLLTQNSLNASKNCYFKKNLNDNSTCYTPIEISGYRYINGKFYISKEIPFKSGEKKIVFMEYLINGVVRVFYFRNKEGDHYFIEKDDVGLVELTDYKQDIQSTPSKYKGKLNYVMSDCPDIIKEIKNTELNPKSLINLGKYYHEKVCSSRECIVYEKKDLKVKYKPYIVIGASLNQYNFANALISSFGNEYQLGVGLKLENVLFSNERFGLDFRLLIEKDSKYRMTVDSHYMYNYEITYNGVDYKLNSHNTFGSIPNLTVYLNVIDLKIPILLNYNYKLSSSEIYTGIGLTDKFIIHQNKKYKDHLFYDQYGKSINSILIGGIANLGYTKSLNNGKAIGVNICYEYLIVPRAVNEFLRLSNKQISFQVNYFFK